MKQLMGFVMLQLAAALFAYKRITEAKHQTDALRSYREMLEHLRGLLESDGSPMPALLETLLKCCCGEAEQFVSSLNAEMDHLGQLPFRELWRRALSENAPALEEEAKQELDALGSVLGRYDLKTQMDSIDACRRILRQRLEERQNMQMQDTRVTLGLSLSASLLLGILLI